jgi:geranylgeranyl diphosphate synthase type I
MDDTSAVAVRTSTTLPAVAPQPVLSVSQGPSPSAAGDAGLGGGGAHAAFDRLMEGFRARLDDQMATFLAGKGAAAAAAPAASGASPMPAPAASGRPASPLTPAAAAPGPPASGWRHGAAADPTGLAELPPLAALVDGVARLMVQGGKRLRPALVYYTYRACGGRLDEQALPLALAIEFLHTYLLIHDDIMDHAGVRRGQPAAHVRFRDLHRASGLRGDADDFGRSAAILVGDLAHTYAVELFTGALTRPGAGAAPDAPLSRQRQAELHRCFSAMCEEVVGGQYLEYLLAHRGPSGDEPEGAGEAAAGDRAGQAAASRQAELLRVLRLKSGRYTAERPIQLGALLAGAPPEPRAELSRYGTAVGEAFQLQDDLLGVFGDPAAVGKPVGDDLREGKFTLLIHHALVHGSPGDRRLIAAALGDPGLTAGDLARVQLALERSGARSAVTAMIAERLAAARDALGALATLAPERFALPGLDAGRAAAATAAGGGAAPTPTADAAHAADAADGDGPRFLSGLLDYLWERER